MSSVRAHSARAIRELDPLAWDAVAGPQLGMCHAWQRVMEASRRHYRPRYVLFEDASGPLAVAVSTDERTANPRWPERVGETLTLAFGAPFTAHLSGIAVRPGSSLSAVLPRVEPLLGSLCWRAGRPFLGFTNVGEQQLPVFRERGFVAVRRPATMVLRLDGAAPEYETYLAGLSKAERAELRRESRRANEHGLELRFEPVDELTSRLYPLFLEICARHGAAPPAAPITPRFFGALASELPNQAHVIVASVHDQTAGFALCVLHGDTLHCPLMGLHYELARQACLYGVLIDQLVRWGLEHRVRTIHLGLTNERQKRRHGFLPQSRWACLRAQPRPLNLAFSAASRLGGARAA